MNVRELMIDSLKQGLLLNVLFFLIFGKRLQHLATEAEKNTAYRRKRSPFVYDMR